MSNQLFDPGQPTAYLTDADDQTLGAFLARLTSAHPEAFIRHLRGSRTRTSKALFDEAAAAFQFDPYFGHNWNAFDESFGDLSSPERPVVAAIFDGDQLLADAPTAELANLAIIVAGGNEPVPAGAAPRSLKLLLQVDPEARAGLEARLEGAGFSYGGVEVPRRDGS